MSRPASAPDAGLDELLGDERACKVLIETGLVVVFRADRSGVIRMVNKAVTRMIGYTPEEVVGRRFTEFQTEDRARRDLETLDRIAAGERVLDYETQLLRKDGSVCDVVTRASPLREDGGLVAIVGVILDVSDRVQRERELRIARVRFEQAFAESPVGRVIASPDGTFLRANKAACEMLGYPPDGLVGLTIGDVSHPSEAEHDAREVRRLIAGEARTHTRKKRYVRPDGETVNAILSITAIRDEAGKVEELRAELVDITELSRAKRRLGYAHALTGLGSWERDLATGWPWWSLGQRRIYGLDPEGPAPTVEQFLEMVHAEDRARVTEARETAVADGDVPPIEFRIVRPDGEVRWVRGRSRGERDAHGQLLRIGGVNEDITEEKRAIERIEDLAEGRRQLLARSLETEEAERRRLALRLHDEALQELLATQLLLGESRERGDGAPAEAEEGLKRGIERLRSIVFEMHPLDAGSSGLEATLRELVAELTRLGSFECELVLEPEVSGVHNHLLLSIVRELLTNVAHHAEATRASASVRSRNGSVVIEVADDGQGIAPGRRREALLKGHIGLASIRERVSAADGTLELETAPGNGTTARVTLPAQVS